MNNNEHKKYIWKLILTTKMFTTTSAHVKLLLGHITTIIHLCALSRNTHCRLYNRKRWEFKKKWKFYNLSIRHQFSLINHVRYVCVLCQYTFFFFATRCTWSRLFRIYIYIYTAVFVQCGVCLLIYFIVSQVITVMAA